MILGAALSFHAFSGRAGDGRKSNVAFSVMLNSQRRIDQTQLDGKMD